MKNYFKIIIAFALVLCVVVSTGAVFGVFADPLEGITVANGSQNLLSNGGFEYCDGINNVGNVAETTPLTDGWLVGSASNTSFTISDDAKVDKYALSAVATENGEFVLLSNKLDSKGILSGLESGVYCLSLYAKGDGVLTINYKDAAVKSETSKPLTLTSEWQQIAVETIVVGPSGKFMFDVSFSGITVLIDEISLTKYTALQNGSFESSTGYIIPDAFYDFGCNTNYNYISTGNPLYNAGFEDATDVSNTTSKSWENAVIVDGWTTNWSHSNFVYSITDDTHSGKYALRLDIAPNVGDTRIHANKDLITDVDLKGRISGLAPNKTYIVSYWFKGTAQSRIFSKNVSDTGADLGNVRGEYRSSPDDWTFVSQEIVTNALGQAWWNINVQGMSDYATYIFVDDVSMLTKEQAIANTEAMIDAFSTKSIYALQAKADIEKWVSILGQNNISNYDVFNVKINGENSSENEEDSNIQPTITVKEYSYIDNGNVLQNPSFEESTKTNVVGYASTITEGWFAGTSFGASSGRTSSIVTDKNNVHSGDKAFSVYYNDNAETGGFLLNKVATSATISNRQYTVTNLQAGQKYIVSYWVKGAAKMSIQYRTPLTSSAYWKHSTYYADVEKQDQWELVYQEITAEEVENYGGVIFFALGIQTKEQTAYIDDVQLVTRAQAIANVEAMIDSLDVKSHYAVRAIADIEQWVAALGSSNVSNYNVFVAKKSIGTNNIIENSGFEKSDVANNSSGKTFNDATITDGWVSHYSASAKFSYSISNDAHSGKNSLKLTMPANSANNDDTRISPKINLITDVELKGRMSGLTPNETYLVSYWIKGSGKSRIFWKTLTSTGGSGTNMRDSQKQSDDWILVVDEVTSYDVGGDGQAWWNINVERVKDKETFVCIDDVSMQTKAQAIADVANMITVFNPNDDNAVKIAKDIEQWVNALGKTNISNYSDFVAKSSQIKNDDFEIDNTAALVNGDFTNVTTGWKTNYVSSKTPYSVSISNDAYSGNNAFKVNVDSVDSGSGFRLLPATANTDGVISGYDANTEYIVSYWVKGTADTRVFGKTNNGSSWVNNWQPKQTSIEDKWSLSTHKIKSDASGNAWWAIFVVGDAADKYAIIDNVNVVSVADAKASVEEMISYFDYKTATDEDVYAITAWMEAVNVSQSAKDEFQSKLADYEALQAELSWESIDNVFGWETNDSTKVTVSGNSVAYGSNSLKIDATQSVGLRPAQIPYVAQEGYYMLVLWAKGGGKLNVSALADENSHSVELLNEDLNLNNGWDRFVISNISLKPNQNLSKLNFTFSDSSEIYLDAVQLYRQIGPGSQLDDITQNVCDNNLLLGGAPDGYYTEIYKSSSDVLSELGVITVPTYNTTVEYRFKITNINDLSDYAVSDIRLLAVNGINGSAPAAKGEEKNVKTLTDSETGVSVTAKMSSDARLTVKKLDETSRYYDLLLNYGNECIAHYDIFNIPQTAYEGDRTITFTVDSKYNGKTLIVARYDKESRALEEYEAKVTDGKLSVTVPNDGAFMIQKLVEKITKPSNNIVNNTDETISQGSSSDKTNDKNTEQNKDKNNGDESFNKPNKQVIVKQKSNTKLIWTIILIGLGVLLLMLIFVVIVILLRRRNNDVEGTNNA